MYIESQDSVEFEIKRMSESQLLINYWVTRYDDNEFYDDEFYHDGGLMLVTSGSFTTKSSAILENLSSLKINDSIRVSNSSISEKITKDMIDPEPPRITSKIFKGVCQIWDIFLLKVT